MATFYMVEMHYPASENRAAFDAFYRNHISMLLTIDGFLSAQRGVRIYPEGKAAVPDGPAEGWTVRTFRPIHAPRHPG